MIRWISTLSLSLLGSTTLAVLLIAMLDSTWSARALQCWACTGQVCRNRYQQDWVKEQCNEKLPDHDSVCLTEWIYVNNTLQPDHRSCWYKNLLKPSEIICILQSSAHAECLCEGEDLCNVHMQYQGAKSGQRIINAAATTTTEKSPQKTS